MPEDLKNPEQVPGGIEVPILDLPSRAERRSIRKTGKGVDGTEAHPDSRKHLRVAVIADLIAFGGEVNKANGALNAKVDGMFKQFGEEIDLRLLEVNWNFGTFLNFLGTSGIFPADFLTKFEEFKKKAEEDLKKEAEEVLKKQEAAAAGAPGEKPSPE